MSEDFSFAKFANNDFYKKQNENLVDPDRKNGVFKKRIFEALGALVKAVERFLGFWPINLAISR